MYAMSNYLEQEILKHIFRTGSYTKPTVLAIALLKTLPSDDAGTGLVELAMTGYARKQVNPLDANWTDPSLGTQGEVDNAAAQSFGTLTGTGERAIGVALYDAVTAGNLYFVGPLANAWQGAVIDATNDKLLAFAHGYSNGDRVFLRGLVGGTGLDEATEYYVVGATTDDFQVSLTLGGAAVTITADGACEAGASQAKDIASGDEAKFNAGELNFQLD